MAKRVGCFADFGRQALLFVARSIPPRVLRYKAKPSARGQDELQERRIMGEIRAFDYALRSKATATGEVGASSPPLAS